MTYRGFETAPQMINISAKLSAADRKSEIEEQIATVLRSFPGVRFQVVFKNGVKPINDRVAQLPKTANEQIGFGANQRISLSDLEGRSNNRPLPFSSVNFSRKETERVSIILDISEEAIVAFQPELESSIPTPKTTRQWAKRLEELQSELRQRLTPVVPLALDERSPFEFRVPDLSQIVNRSRTPIFPWDRIRWWPTSAILFVSCIGLVVGTRSRRNNLVDGERTSRQETDQRKRNAEEQLSRLVDSDPESAAQVLKSWLHESN